MERLRRLQLGELVSRWGAIASLLLGLFFLLAGAALVAKHASSNDGSQFGWLFIVLGLCGLLATIGFYTGFYE